MKPTELGALIAALHRANQLGYPIMVIGAGLPKIYAMLSAEKSYSERLFLYKEIGSLDTEQSKKAIEIPAQKLHVSYSDEAVEKITELSKGYPFFIQQLCQLVFDYASDQVITLDDVNAVDVYKRQVSSSTSDISKEITSDTPVIPAVRRFESVSLCAPFACV